MRTIKVEPLTYEAYAPYGTFYNMTEPAGYSLNGELHRFFSGPDDGVLHNQNSFFTDSCEEAGSDEDHTGRVSYNHSGDYSPN